MPVEVKALIHLKITEKCIESGHSSPQSLLYRSYDCLYIIFLLQFGWYFSHVGNGANG